MNPETEMSTISVIIPAYNREAYLAEAIESALGQTLPPDEIIVVDDGSSDRTAEIARSYGREVRCISQENQGAGVARNAGVKEAQGSLIAFLDSDDLWLDRKLEAQAAFLRMHPETDMVFCHMKPFLSPEIDPAQGLKFDPREIAACNAPSILARREAFVRVGEFPTARNVPEFFPWFARASDMGLTHHILPELLLLRRIHPGNMVHDPEWRSRYLRFVKKRLDESRGSKTSPA
jgi:glycosyltransferase involved in cell wall biosynthesis